MRSTSPLKLNSTIESKKKNYSTIEKNHNQSFLAPIFEKSQKVTKKKNYLKNILENEIRYSLQTNFPNFIFFHLFNSNQYMLDSSLHIFERKQ